MSYRLHVLVLEGLKLSPFFCTLILAAQAATSSARVCPFLFPHPQSVSSWWPHLGPRCVSTLTTCSLVTGWEAPVQSQDSPLTPLP